MLFKMSASKMNFVEKKKNLDCVLLAGTVWIANIYLKKKRNDRSVGKNFAIAFLGL